MADFVGAVDQGTTSTRFMLFDHGGNEVGKHQLEHGQDQWHDHQQQHRQTNRDDRKRDHGANTVTALGSTENWAGVWVMISPSALTGRGCLVSIVT